MTMNSRVVLGIYRSSILMLAVFCVACSSGGRHYGQMTETLTIEILPDTSKQFVYRLHLPAGVAPDPLLVPRARVERDPHPQPDRRAYQRLRENVERALAQTGYCREGYLELDRRLALHTLWLRGECREGASNEDLARFGGLNTLSLKQGAKR